MAYMRRDVRGTTGQDIEKINSNFMDIFDKVFGNINFSDADTKMKNDIGDGASAFAESKVKNNA